MKKKIISALSAVLMVILALAVIVGCGEEEAKPEAYTVTFKDGEAIVKTVDVEKDTALTAEQIPAGPTHAGQVFDGWFVGETEVEAGYKPTADVTAAAKYHADDETTGYTVEYYSGVYNNNGITGDTPQTVTVTPGDEIELVANPWKRAGYQFKGYNIQHKVETTQRGDDGLPETVTVWKDIEGETNKQPGYEYTPTEDIRVVAQWAEATITVKYDSNGGRGTIADTSGTWNKGITLTTASFTPPEGKEFAGWALTQTGPALAENPVGSNKVLFNDVKDSLVLQADGSYELTLYALWKEGTPAPAGIAALVGVWSGDKGQVIISDCTEGEAELYGDPVGSIIIDNEYILLGAGGSDNQFYGFKHYYDEDQGYDMVLVTYADGQLTVAINEEPGDVYTSKTAISNAPKTDFIGKWKRDNTTQVWNIQEDKATTTRNGDEITASVFVIIGKYLVIEYEGANQLLLTKADANLVGYYTASEKAPVAATFTPYTDSGEGGGGGGGTDPVTKSGYYPESDDTVAEYTVSSKTYKLLWFEIEGTTIKYRVSIDGEEQEMEATLTSQNSGYYTEGSYPVGERKDYTVTIGKQLGILIFNDGTAYILDHNTEAVIGSNKYVHKDAN